MRRLRTKSSACGPSTWVFAASRRNDAECTTRARSRSNGVRSGAWHPLGRLVDEPLARGVVVQLVPGHGAHASPSQPPVSARRWSPPRPGWRRRSCRSPRRGGCARCPRRGTASSAIAETAAPPRAARSTSVSRAVSGDSPANRLSVASTGSTTRRPAWTRRTASASWAAGVSLTTKPDAPGLHRAAEETGAAEGGHDQHAYVGELGQQRGRRRRCRRGRASRHRAAPRRGGAAGRPRRPGRPRTPRPPPRGRARARAAPTARRGRAPGRRPGAAGWSSRSRQHHGEREAGVEGPRDDGAARPRRRARAGRCSPLPVPPGAGPDAVVADLDAVGPEYDGAARRAAVPDHVGDALRGWSTRTARAGRRAPRRPSSAARPRSRRPRARCAPGPARRGGSARDSPPPLVVRRPARRGTAARGRPARPGRDRVDVDQLAWPARP